MKKLFGIILVCSFILVPASTVGADQELTQLPEQDKELPVIVVESELPSVIENEPPLQEELEQEKLPEFEMLLHDDAFLTLCATVHLEAGEENTSEAKFCVAKVVLNRLNDTDTWGYGSIQDVVYAPGQFSVVHKKSFNSIKQRLQEGDFDENLLSSVMASYFAYLGIDLCVVESDVQYFNIDFGYSSWGGHKRAFACGGNCFYYK